jgi:predicted small secreted protein
MKHSFPLVLAALLTLGGCTTLQGFGEDISKGYEAITNSVVQIVNPAKEQKKKLPVYDGTCPPVSVRPDLVHLVDFSNPAQHSEKTKISEITILGVQNTCRVENGALLMQIDIALSGKTGPKARVKTGDQPSFAYPYFVAVTDSLGNVVSKEIFAASIGYGRDKNVLTMTETIFQNMPFPDPKAGTTYSVIVGFQLSPEQLAYNQTMAQKGF